LRYTYDISFNGSNYVDFTPSNKIEFTTSAEDGFLYRTEINEIKISKFNNLTVYATLETWFTDSAKLANEILVRQKKGSTVKWTGAFGIKWGTLNEENGFYQVAPRTVDAMLDIDQSFKAEATRPTTELQISLINEDDGADEKTTFYGNTLEQYFDTVTTKIAADSGNTYEVVSSSFFNDTLPSGASGSDYYQSNLDAVYAGGVAKLDGSSYKFVISELFDVLKQFNAFWYVDENSKIRIETLNYFEDLIENYEIDLTNNEIIIPEFEYSITETFIWEKFKTPDTDTTISPDWDSVNVRYNGYRTQINPEEKVITNNFYTNFVKDQSGNSPLCMHVSANMVGAFQSILGYKEFETVEDVEKLTIDLEYDPTDPGGTTYAKTGYLDTSLLFTFEVIVSYAYGTGNELRLNYNDGGSGSDVRVLTAGTHSFTKTLTAQTHVTLEPNPDAGPYPEGWDNPGSCIATVSLKITRSGRGRIMWGDGIRTSELVPNNYLSWSNLFNEFWKNGRFSRKGYVSSGSEETFESTIYNKKLREFKIFYEDDIDPLRGVLTDYGVARIESYKRDENDMVTFTLTYQEDV